MKLAAIDIGSNAVRLLFINVYETPEGPQFIKDAMYRVPLRLGDEVFLKGKLTKAKAKEFVHMMQAFKKLMKVHQPVAYMACATSAMRDASNAEEVLQKIRKKAGIHIEVISGQDEAEIIFSNHVEKFSKDPDSNYLYIDVGGGSTELVLMSGGEQIDKGSFNIGTLRLKHNKVSASDWAKLDSWVQKYVGKYNPLLGIGSGGNINTMIKYFGKTQKQELDRSVIEATYDKLKDLTVDERILQYNMKPDRADVIVPAAEIFLRIMKQLDIQKVLIPKVGLADGIVHQMYERILDDLAETDKV